MKILQNLCFIILLIAGFSGTLMAQAVKNAGYAPVNGLKMYYEIHGEGKPLLLLHGSFMTIDLNWAQLIPEWAKHNKVIAVEMQGHGRTTDNDKEISYVSLAADAAALLKYLKIDSAAVVGYSLGGTVAFQLAIDHPEMVTKLIAISTVSKTTGWKKEVNEAIHSMTPDFLDATPLKTMYESVAPDPKHWKAFIEKMLRFEKKEFDLGDENMKQLKMPAMFIMGDNDGVELQHKIDLYRWFGGGTFADMAGFPKARLSIIPATGHVTLMMETKKILEVTNPFLQDIPPMVLQ